LSYGQIKKALEPER